jgi:hypothetical protein
MKTARKKSMPENGLPKVMVPIEVPGFKKTYVNIYQVVTVQAFVGKRAWRYDKVKDRMYPKFAAKHPILSILYNPYSPDLFPNHEFIRANVQIIGPKDEVLYTFWCRSNESALRTVKLVKRQLGML